MSRDLVLRGGRVGAGGSPSDVLIRAGRVVAVEPWLALDESDAEVIHLSDATVLPGFVDAHVHVDQWVHGSRRVDVRAARSAADVVDLMRAHVDTPTGRSARVVVGYGFVDALWQEHAHRRLLDVAFGSLPVAVLSSDLHTVWMSGGALALVGRTDHPTGLLREQECMQAVSTLMNAEDEEVVDGWVHDQLAVAASRGVTGLVDFEYADNLTTWTRRARRAPLPVRVVASVWRSWLDAAVSAGLHTGDPLVPDRSALVGPYKVMADGSLNTRTAYCHHPYEHVEPAERFGLRLVTTDDLVQQLLLAHDAGLEPAIHAIGDAANTTVLDAFVKVGFGGRIEHAQLVLEEDIARFAAAGVVASVQPQHAVADRDVADRHWCGRTARAFPFASLHAAGVELRLGSDAPVSPLDPLQAVADAVARTDDERPPWHPEQALPIGVALAAACDGRSTVEAGMAADLTVIAGDIASAEPEAIRHGQVLLTLLSGRITNRVC